MPLSHIGKYEVQRRLGTGAVGSLYLARDPSLDRLVALKLLKDEFQDDPELRERFTREARSVARLRHQHIIIVYEIGEADGRPFMAMEYIAGETLTQVLRRSPSPPLARRLALGEDLCDGLAHAHAAGIIHRDIKPANIMLDRDGVLKILDFGIARLGGSAGMTQDGTMMGSVNYMSPEQVVGRGVDHRSDIFAAGAVLYELVALEQAFPGGIDTGVLNRILHEGPVPLGERVPGVDPELAGIVQHALERDPERRYQDANAMGRDLARVRRRLLEADHESAAASPPDPAVVPSPIASLPDAGRRSDKSVAQWIDRVASALAYAHRRGLVHGDIKPTAIVFDGDDNPYVTDFAIAQQTETVVGAPAYMAPELWESGTPSPAVDQFALAALSYYLITGSHPFEGQDHPEIRRRNFAQGPLAAHTEAEHNGRKGLLRGVSYVLARGLAREPQDRYPTIADFAAALSAALVRPTRRPDAAQLFFSYQRESMAGWVNYFADRVRSSGLSVFVDTQNRGSGTFPEQLARAIEDAMVFVCFVGERTLESKWVQDEITLAFQYGKPMIPVFQEGYVRPAEDASFPAMKKLLTSQGVHLQDRRNLNPEGSVADLVLLAQRNIEVEEGPPR